MKKISLVLACLFSGLLSFSQIKELKYNLNDDGKNYLKLTALSQVWVRFNENNPGSKVYNDLQSESFDIGIRRLRFQLLGQVTDRVFVYAQFGQNNLNYLSARKVGSFFHDATVEYTFVPKHLSIGAGLTGWSGLGRFASPSVGSILMMDAPLFEQATNDVTDQFLRKLSVFAKGKIGKLDYRMAISNPLPVQSSYGTTVVSAVDTTLTTKYATFSPNAPSNQYQGYFMYQFLDEESNLTPYTTGSYLGKKKVFNIGAGFVYQSNATRSLSPDSSSKSHDLIMAGLDVFYDTPLDKEKGTALTLYGGVFNFNYGPNYVRYLGVMNTANGSSISDPQKLRNFGNAFPMNGTGTTILAEAGYLMKKDLLGSQGTLQPYAGITYSNFDRLKDPCTLLDVGVNWLIKGHNSKMSFHYQNRPVFNPNSAGDLISQDRKGMFVIQYQIAIL